jgi:hypothetical protein
MIKYWSFRFSGETTTREIPYGDLEAYMEKLPLPESGVFFKKDIDSIRDLKLKTMGKP